MTRIAPPRRECAVRNRPHARVIAAGTIRGSARSRGLPGMTMPADVARALDGLLRSPRSVSPSGARILVEPVAEALLRVLRRDRRARCRRRVGGPRPAPSSSWPARLRGSGPGGSPRPMLAREPRTGTPERAGSCRSRPRRRRGRSVASLRGTHRRGRRPTPGARPCARRTAPQARAGPRPVRASATVTDCSSRLSLSPGLRRHVARCLNWPVRPIAGTHRCRPDFRWPGVARRRPVCCSSSGARSWRRAPGTPRYRRSTGHAPPAQRPIGCYLGCAIGDAGDGRATHGPATRGKKARATVRPASSCWRTSAAALS